MICKQCKKEFEVINPTWNRLFCTMKCQNNNRQERYRKSHYLYFDIPGPYCAYCGHPPSGKDHVWPLARIEERLPGHMIYTVPACRRCNSIGSKHAFRCFDLKQSFITTYRMTERFGPYVIEENVDFMYRLIRKVLQSRGHTCDIPEEVEWIAYSLPPAITAENL